MLVFLIIILIITNHLISFLASLIISLVCIWINFLIALDKRLLTSWFDYSTAVFLTYCIIANGTNAPISPSSALRYDQRDIYYALTILLKRIMSSALRTNGQLPSGCIDARINVYLLNLRYISNASPKRHRKRLYFYAVSLSRIEPML